MQVQNQQYNDYNQEVDSDSDDEGMTVEQGAIVGATVSITGVATTAFSFAAPYLAALSTEGALTTTLVSWGILSPASVAVGAAAQAAALTVAGVAGPVLAVAGIPIGLGLAGYAATRGR